jgi:hypothetical protein
LEKNVKKTKIKTGEIRKGRGRTPGKETFLIGGKSSSDMIGRCFKKDVRKI